MSLRDVPVADEEDLARFVLFNSHLRKAEGVTTARPEAFLPYKHVELSVTRHRNLTRKQIWGSGECVAKHRSLKLLGRADITAASVRLQKLQVKPNEPPKNHADIIGWPIERPAQMLFAIELATASTYVAAYKGGE